MRILLDECLPKRLAGLFPEHQVRTARQMNWAGLKNGNLLRVAESEFNVFITVDKNIVHQQNVPGFDIAVMVIRSISKDIETLRPLAPEIRSALERARPGTVVVVGK